MISFHLAALKDIPSILKFGLIGKRPRLDHHLERFKSEGLQGDKVVYSFGDSSKNFKFARDTLYGKQWINPRNDITIKQDGFDFSKDKTLYLRDEVYVLLKIVVEDSKVFKTYVHSQTGNKNPFDSLFEMDSNFEHDDKPLVMFQGNVKPEYIMPVELYCTEVSKNKKLVVRTKRL